MLLGAEECSFLFVAVLRNSRPRRTELVRWKFEHMSLTRDEIFQYMPLKEYDFTGLKVLIFL